MAYQRLRQIAAIDAELRALCGADVELKAQIAILISMPALVAIHFNADIKAKYQALRAAGKPPKVAITAIMRKLAILANVLLREQRNWAPKVA